MEKPYRLIVWGVGEIGGSVVNAVRNNKKFEIVGAKVNSPNKHDQDIGVLAGGEAIGVRATLDKNEIFSTEADVVILTPDARSIRDGLDDDVIALLESGKNVISTVAYHNVTMEDSFCSDRATASRLQDACIRGGSSLLGTGVHPSFMVECVAMTVARALTSTSHIRIVEAFDFSVAPEGMWGGLEALGFGSDLSEICESSFIYQFGDLYYPKICGNVGYALYGAETKDIRIESSVVGLPAERDFSIHSLTIKEGTTAALHMTHRGFLGEHNFYTNEEIWFLGGGITFRGHDLPFGGFKGPLCYTLEVNGDPANWRTQIEVEATAPRNPITNVSVEVMLQAVGPVCIADPGILLDDHRPRYKADARVC